MASQNPADTAGCLRRLSSGVCGCPGSPAACGQYGKIITVNNGVVKIGGVAILQRGVQTITLSTTEQDYTIDFNEDFLGWPSVTFSVQRAGYASQTYAVLKSRGAQGFTITAASGANSNLAVTISWIAMYTPD